MGVGKEGKEEGEQREKRGEKVESRRDNSFRLGENETL